MLAILLAAGRGRRLGAPKATIDLEGRSALERCLDALGGGGLGPVRVVLPADDAAMARVVAAGHETVVNAEPERGQTRSLQLALSAGGVEPDGFAIHTVDHPLAEARDVERLLEAWARRPEGTDIVVPSVDGRRGHPALFAAGLAAELLALAEDEPAHRVLRRDPDRILHLTMDNPWLVRDIDTPDDLAAARAALCGR